MDRRPTGDTVPAPLSPRSHRRSPARGPSGPSGRWQSAGSWSAACVRWP